MQEAHNANVIAEFSASIPPIQSATSIGGDGACRLKLDVPASDLAEVMKLAGFGMGKHLKITVEATEEARSPNDRVD